MEISKELLDRIESVLSIATSAAGKLDVEMCIRHSMPSWYELEMLVGQKEELRSIRKELLELRKQQ